ncbi:hypothetical protein [Streptomyces sp. Ag109_O5-10]|uniref:hypothetical protein n=1 Tax=Streptomyces sp. Ag109_O5-10 TaxID=1855349 RepID=UPI000B8431E1|nr:hypothetical protein [Streptomyces sp. Ag109_O5-10]
MTEPFVPRGTDDRRASTAGRWTKQSAGATFAALAGFLITRDVTFGLYVRTLPGRAYTATVLTGFAVSAVVYRLARLWLRRLP